MVSSEGRDGGKQKEGKIKSKKSERDKGNKNGKQRTTNI